MRTITSTIIENGEKLKEPREEHQEVEELTQDEKKYNDAYDKFLVLDNLPCYLKYLIRCAALFLYGSCAIFALKASFVFENFEVSGHIRDPIDAYGLGGDPCKIVR